MNPLTDWQNFYMIVGSAAGALTGLQFVVMALVADMPLASQEVEAGAAFSSPSVVHFSAVLLLSALLAMPWHGVGAVAVAWGLTGIAGLLYTGFVALRMRRQKAYQPVMEDWFFRAVIPAAAYLSLAGSAVLARTNARPALFMLAASALALLFIGIHNAWDNVVYLVFVKRNESRQG
jgi:hypothetical protein